MSKIRLAVEELSVESFATQAADRGHGTVFARGERTADGTCENTCPDTCHASCYQHGGCSFESCPGSCPMAGGTCYATCDALKCPPQDTTTLTSRG